MRKYTHLSFAQYLETGVSVTDTKFGTNVSNKMLLNAPKMPGLQLYSFYRFWVIKGKPTGGMGGGKIITP